MTPIDTDPAAVPPSTTDTTTTRRPFLRALATAGAVGAFGLPALTGTVGAAVPGVTIDYRRCHVAFVSNASALDTIAVYYADRNGDRNARYDIAPTTTDPRGYAPLVVEYDPDEDRTQIQLAEPRGGLVSVIAEAGSDRTVRTNPTDACVPAGFNTAPTASFTVSENPTVGEPVTFTSTATDPDSPERLSYAWDLDGDGTFETGGETATRSYATAGDVTVSLRVTDDLGASDTATATVTITAPATAGLSFVEKLTVESDRDRNRFGWDVSVDGDTAAVLALPGSGTHVVYFLSRGTDGSWDVDQSFFVRDGATVSLDGDAAIVGANLADEGAPNGGGAYAFARDGDGVWRRTGTLSSDDPSLSGYFGSAVSVVGDVAVIGEGGPNREGRAHVFAREGDGRWTRRQVVAASDGRSRDYFGWDVAFDGRTILVGAYSSQKAYVFTRDPTGRWTERAILSSASVRSGDGFGYSVSVDGDVAVVGTRRFQARTGGEAYVFARDANGEWVEQKLAPEDPATTGRFGYEVFVTGETVFVGAYLEDPEGVENAGALYVYGPEDGVWTERERLTAPDPVERGSFGVSLDSDGETLLVGAIGSPLPDLDTGAVYVYTL